MYKNEYFFFKIVTDAFVSVCPLWLLSSLRQLATTVMSTLRNRSPVRRDDDSSDEEYRPSRSRTRSGSRTRAGSRSRDQSEDRKQASFRRKMSKVVKQMDKTNLVSIHDELINYVEGTAKQMEPTDPNYLDPSIMKSVLLWIPNMCTCQITLRVADFIKVKMLNDLARLVAWIDMIFEGISVQIVAIAVNPDGGNLHDDIANEFHNHFHTNLKRRYGAIGGLAQTTIGGDVVVKNTVAELVVLLKELGKTATKKYRQSVELAQKERDVKRKEADTRRRDRSAESESRKPYRPAPAYQPTDQQPSSS